MHTKQHSGLDQRALWLHIQIDTGDHSSGRSETATSKQFLPNFSRQASRQAGVKTTGTHIILPLLSFRLHLIDISISLDSILHRLDTPPFRPIIDIDISMATKTSVTTGAAVAVAAANTLRPTQINEQHMAVDPIPSNQEFLRSDITTDMNDLSIPALKERCRQRGLRIGGSRSALISRLTGIPVAPPAASDPAGGAELTSESIQRIMATMSEGENNTLCRLSQLARMCSIMRNILQNRLTHGVRKWGRLFLGACALDDFRFLMARDGTCIKSWTRKISTPFDGKWISSTRWYFRFEYNEKKPNCGLPKLGSTDEWWYRLAHVFQGQRSVYQHYYTSLVFSICTKSNRIYCKWEQQTEQLIFGSHWMQTR
ncbi:hypothetical protein PROFUN_16654 [Planoprotostelium fungivorum]|uniref:SAP domain-containing protein n=1 Tax=Planoprotostelium fungivorum TaxID=1890364 RepID=A0A2P6MPX1_9EUKA|nr:hypothetical protein PROFUN_16654 [Planoprotostelium fungivorum]